jgi:hypothetical protein
MKRTLRASALAIAAGLIAAVASAAPIASPDSAFSIDTAKKWKIEKAPQGTPEGTNLWVAGDGEQYCYFNAKQRPDTALSSAANVIKSMQVPLSAEKWVATATPVFDALFSKGVPVAKATTTETVNGWPIQYVEFDGYKYGPVVAALHMRPGLEIQTYCSWEDGADHRAEFKAIALSVSTARDAAWQAEAAAAAIVQPAAPTPAAEPPKKR